MQIDKRIPVDASESDDDPEDEDKRTIFCHNLSDRITEELLCELFIQGGPVESVRIPTDKDGRPRNFGFVTYVHSCSVQYALKLFDGVRLFNRLLTLRSNSNNSFQQHQQQQRSRMPPPAPILRKDISNAKLLANGTNQPNLSSHINNSSALRLGGGASSSSIAKNTANIRFDSSLQPSRQSANETNDKSRNPFKVDLDVLSRLSSNLLPAKEQKNGNDISNNKPIAKRSRSSRERDKHHPCKRSNKSDSRSRNYNLWGGGGGGSYGFNERNRNQKPKGRRR